MRVFIKWEAALLGQPGVHLARIELFNGCNYSRSLLTPSRKPGRGLLPSGFSEDFVVNIECLLVKEGDLEFFESWILNEFTINLAELDKSGLVLEHSWGYKEVLMLKVPLFLARREEPPAEEACGEFEFTLRLKVMFYPPHKVLVLLGAP